MSKCLVCNKEMTILSPSARGGFSSECKDHGCVTQQVQELRLQRDCLRADLMSEREQVERLRAALQQARLYVDGTLGPERPVVVAEIDLAMTGEARLTVNPYPIDPDNMCAYCCGNGRTHNKICDACHGTGKDHPENTNEASK